MAEGTYEDALAAWQKHIDDALTTAGPRFTKSAIGRRWTVTDHLTGKQYTGRAWTHNRAWHKAYKVEKRLLRNTGGAK